MWESIIVLLQKFLILLGENYEWLLSGVGVAIGGAVFRWIKNKTKRKSVNESKTRKKDFDRNEDVIGYDAANVKEILRDGGKSIGEIAYDLGFSNELTKNIIQVLVKDGLVVMRKGKVFLKNKS